MTLNSHQFFLPAEQPSCTGQLFAGEASLGSDEKSCSASRKARSLRLMCSVSVRAFDEGFREEEEEGAVSSHKLRRSGRSFVIVLGPDLGFFTEASFLLAVVGRCSWEEMHLQALRYT